MDKVIVNIVLTWVDGVKKVQILSKNNKQAKEGFRLVEALDFQIRALDRKIKKLRASKDKAVDLTLVKGARK